MNRVVIVVGSILAALLVAVLVVGVVLLNTMNAQREQDEYRACLARYGVEHDAPPPEIGSDAELDEYVAEVAEIAERCYALTR